MVVGVSESLGDAQEATGFERAPDLPERRVPSPHLAEYHHEQYPVEALSGKGSFAQYSPDGPDVRDPLRRESAPQPVQHLRLAVEGDDFSAGGDGSRCGNRQASRSAAGIEDPHAGREAEVRDQPPLPDDRVGERVFEHKGKPRRERYRPAPLPQETGQRRECRQSRQVTE